MPVFALLPLVKGQLEREAPLWPERGQPWLQACALSYYSLKTLFPAVKNFAGFCGVPLKWIS